MNDEEIVNDVVSMFIMGRETLTSALIQVLHQILSDRAVYIRYARVTSDCLYKVRVTSDCLYKVRVKYSQNV